MAKRKIGKTRARPEARPKHKAKGPPARPEPSEADIRAYAYHLYRQGNGAPGQAVDNWMEARACLWANIPADRSRARLHHFLNGR